MTDLTLIVGEEEIEIREDLADRLVEIAEEEDLDLEDFLNQIILDYLKDEEDD